MAFDGHAHRRITLQPGGLAAKQGLVAFLDIVLVEGEVDGIADIDAQVFGAAV